MTKYLAALFALISTAALAQPSVQPGPGAGPFGTAAITGGTISGASVGSPTPSTGAFTTLSTTGNFTMGGALNGVTMSGGTLSGYNGNLFVGSEQNPSSYTGTESVFIGDRTGANVTTGNFNAALGLDTIGVGTGCTGLYVNNTTVMGTDALRNTCGNSSVTLFGVSAMKFYSQAGTSSNNYAFGMVGIGGSVFLNWNAPVAFPYNTSIGDQSCMGASTGTVNFTGVICVGAMTGRNLTSASNTILISGGVNGSAGITNFASGSGVVLIASGANSVDTPAAGTTNYVNIENAYIASTAVPTYTSGFGTNAGWAGFGTGYTSQHFGWRVGTGGTASTGSFTFPTAAPNGWYCSGRDQTNPASFVEDFTSNSTTKVTVTNYSRTTGGVVAWTSGDVLDVNCVGY